MSFIFLEELCPILAFVFVRALRASLPLSSLCFGCTFPVPGVGFGPAHFWETVESSERRAEESLPLWSVSAATLAGSFVLRLPEIPLHLLAFSSAIV